MPRFPLASLPAQWRLQSRLCVQSHQTEQATGHPEKAPWTADFGPFLGVPESDPYPNVPRPPGIHQLFLQDRESFSRQGHELLKDLGHRKSTPRLTMLLLAWVGPTFFSG